MIQNLRDSHFGVNKAATNRVYDQLDRRASGSREQYANLPMEDDAYSVQQLIRERFMRNKEFNAEAADKDRFHPLPRRCPCA